MPTKLGRKTLPKNFSVDLFKYQGRPAADQNDFDSQVGIADMVCVNQFGDANNNKYYHAGVVQAQGSWFVYLEWGRVSGGGKSWDPHFKGQDFQFVSCANEQEARSFFQKQCQSKNIKRLEQKKIKDKVVWVGKSGKDGYVVQRLATRERGLPDAYLIKDSSGLDVKKLVKNTKQTRKAQKTDEHPQVIELAKSLVGGTAEYARAASKASGVTPTMEAINEVRDYLIPEALELLKKIGENHSDQMKNKKLQTLSTYVATIVPRPIPRGGDASAVLLTANNILSIQQDLDVFEGALKNESWELESQSNTEINSSVLLGRTISWIDPNESLGKWLKDTYLNMTNNRHDHLRKPFKILNMFSVEDKEKSKKFLSRTLEIGENRQYHFHDRAGLQPDKRPDIPERSDLWDWYDYANVCLGVHGTRGVNVQPILSTNLRLPKSLQGVHITGSAFGHGIYFATDIKKSHGYTDNGYYGNGGGGVKGRGFFMFLCDVTLGKCFMAKRTMWDQSSCPKDSDSIFAKRGLTSVQNDEHVVFDPNQQQIRYLIEATV